MAEKHSTVKPVVVLVYLGEGQRGGAAAVEAAALMASSSSSSAFSSQQQPDGSGGRSHSGGSAAPQVVLVVQNVSVQALAMAESVHPSSISAHEVFQAAVWTFTYFHLHLNPHNFVLSVSRIMR